MEHNIKLLYDGGPMSADEVLQRIFSLTQVPLVRCVKVHAGYKVFVSHASQLSPFLSADGQKKLKSAGFRPVLSPETKARCTVVAKKVDRTVTTRTSEDILKDVAARNDVTVEDVYMPPNTRIVKIRCMSPEEAQKLLKNGIRMFHTSVPAYNLESESYIDIPQCYKCYRYDHLKSACDKPQRCSRCGEEGHFFVGCIKEIKCCNCGGSHTAVSGACPEKKKLLRDGRQQLKNSTYTTITQASTLPSKQQPSTSRTYTSAASSGIPVRAATTTTTMNTPTTDTQKIVTILHTSLILSKYNTRTFIKLAKQLLQRNGMPDIEIPEDVIPHDTLTLPTHPDVSVKTIIQELSPESPARTPAPSTSKQPLVQRKQEKSTRKRVLTQQHLSTPETKRKTMQSHEPQEMEVVHTVHQASNRDADPEVDPSFDLRVTDNSDDDTDCVVSRALFPRGPPQEGRDAVALREDAEGLEMWSVTSTDGGEVESEHSDSSLPDLGSPYTGSARGRHPPGQRPPTPFKKKN